MFNKKKQNKARGENYMNNKTHIQYIKKNET